MKRGLIWMLIGMCLFSGCSRLEEPGIKQEGIKENSAIDFDTPHSWNQEALLLYDLAIENAMKAGFPGGQLIVIDNRQVVLNKTYGVIQRYDQKGNWIESTPVNENTLYDLASNTKMLCTNLILMKMVYDGRIRLNQTLPEFFAEADKWEQDDLRRTITLDDLLYHQAGFCPDPQYHNEHASGCFENSQKNPLFSQQAELTKQQVLNTPLSYAPKEKQVYSDVDYILLGMVIEKVAGMPLDEVFEKEIAKPLNLSSMTFNPLQHGFQKEDCAATELVGNTRENHVEFRNIRTETIQGEVHDEKAYYSMQGVAGHAGLFSNAKEIAILLQLMLNGGEYMGVRLFDVETIKLFLMPLKEGNQTFGRGWRRMGEHEYTGIFGDQVSDQTFGHTGWTGTLTMMDPKANLSLVWLCNKVSTPLLVPDQDYNDFEGSHYAMVQYRQIVQMMMLARQGDVVSMIDEVMGQIEKKKDSTYPVDVRDKEGMIKTLLAFYQATHNELAKEKLLGLDIEMSVSLQEEINQLK